MRTRRALLTVAALVVAALTAGAVPAFTADNGTVEVSVMAGSGGACLTVAPGNVAFGDVPFSTSGDLSGAGQNLTISNCGPDLKIFGSTTNATGPSGSWIARVPTTGSLLDFTTFNPCPVLDEFFLYLHDGEAEGAFLTGTAALLTDYFRSQPVVFPAGDTYLELLLFMPCEGSSGAGETKTMTVTLAGVAA